MSDKESNSSRKTPKERRDHSKTSKHEHQSGKTKPPEKTDDDNSSED